MELEMARDDLRLEMQYQQREIDMRKCLIMIILGEAEQFHSKNPRMTSDQMISLLLTAVGAMQYTLTIACDKDGEITARDAALSIIEDFECLLDESKLTG
jgi:hypothetical protein